MHGRAQPFSQATSNVLLGNVWAGQAHAFFLVSSSAAARLWWQPRESFALNVNTYYSY